ncbi:Uncharacterised protein [Enterobacter cloacae]|nr:Uncharacterised protein [Enterobacter cloacae]
MSTISKERLEQLASGNAWVCVQDDEAAELARIALASLEAEPVGEVSEQRDGLVMDGMVDLGGASTHRIIKGASKMKRFPLGTKFYTAPPAPVSVPDAMEMDDDFDSAFEHGKAVGWNAYRAAMLQGARNHPEDNLDMVDHSGDANDKANSPLIPDWQTQAEKMAELYGSSFVLFRNGESPQCADPTKVIISFTDEGLGHGSAAPKQEV